MPKGYLPLQIGSTDKILQVSYRHLVSIASSVHPVSESEGKIRCKKMLVRLRCMKCSFFAPCSRPRERDFVVYIRDLDCLGCSL